MARSIPTKTAVRRAQLTLVHEFLIVLTGIEPLIWRRIEVPEVYALGSTDLAVLREAQLARTPTRRTRTTSETTGYPLHEWTGRDRESNEFMVVDCPAGVPNRTNCGLP